MSKKPQPPSALGDKLAMLSRYLEKLARDYPALEAVAAKNLAEQIRQELQKPKD